MSWDVVVFDFQGSPPPIDEWEGDSGFVPLGSPEEVRGKIDAFLPGVDWSDPETGIYEGDEYSFEIRILEEENVENFIIAVRGSGDAVAALLQLATPNMWSLLDGSTTEWIDPANPSKSGWAGFQEFRDRAMEAAASEPENAPEPETALESESVAEETGPVANSPEPSAPAESASQERERPPRKKAAAKKAAPKKKKAAKRKATAKKTARGKKGAVKKGAPKKKSAAKKSAPKKKKAAGKKKAAPKKTAAKKGAPRKKASAKKSAKKTAKKSAAKKGATKKKRKAK